MENDAEGLLIVIWVCAVLLGLNGLGGQEGAGNAGAMLTARKASSASKYS